MSRAHLHAEPPPAVESRGRDAQEMQGMDAVKRDLVAEHAAGEHEQLDEYVDGCGGCEMKMAEDEARYEADHQVWLAEERRRSERVYWAHFLYFVDRDDDAYVCDSCESGFVLGNEDEGQGPLYSCGRCGERSTLEELGGINRCSECNYFMSREAEIGCPECQHGALEMIDLPDEVMQAALADLDSTMPASEFVALALLNLKAQATVLTI